MSSLFISHSSRDADDASELRDRLLQWGYESIFLDFDPERGIPAGRDWERELYRRLKACRALVALCSAESVASRWCFAEITQAKALGKPIFPLKTGPCRIEGVLTDRQVADLTADREGGYRRLRKGLEQAGLAPNFGAEPSRPPYPGLNAFEASDAAYFLGRDDEIAATLERLVQMRRHGEPRLALVLGASGSGKSSLVRAGIVPRLSRDAERWLVVPPFRPGDRPAASAAQALAELFRRLGDDRDWRSILDQVHAGPEAWPQLCADLKLLAGAREASVLLVLDQLEETLRDAGASAADPLLPGLLEAAGRSDGSPLVLATLRSDFLNDWQRHPGVASTEFATLPLGPLPASKLPVVIEGPADLKGLELEPGLVQRILADTASDTALPLLAFTLRELYERCKDRGRLELGVYERELGGIEGSVGKVAAEVISRESLPGETERALRGAFLRMVRLNEEGEYARRRARWDELPSPARPLLMKLVDHRLLVTGGEGQERWIEVAHETLFSAWPTLEQWLDEERGFLLWRRRLRADRTEWDHHGRDPGSLLQGAALAEARTWAERRREDLEATETDFIAASLDAESCRRRRKRILRLGAALIALILLGLGAWAVHLQGESASRQRLAAARALAVQAAQITADGADDLQVRALLAAAALRRFVALGERSPEAALTLRRSLGFLPARTGFFPQENRTVADTAFGPGPRDLSLAFRGELEVVVIDRDDGSLAEHRHRSPGVGHPEVFLSDDGRHFAAAFTGTNVDPRGTVHLWRVGEPDPVTTLPFQGRLQFLEIAAVSGFVAVKGSDDEAIRLYHPDGAALGTVPGNGGAPSFDATGRRLAVPGTGGAVWRLDDPPGSPPSRVRSYGEGGVIRKALFGASGDPVGWIRSLRRPAAAKYFETSSGVRLPLPLVNVPGPVALSAGTRYLAVAATREVHLYRLGTDRTARIDPGNAQNPSRRVESLRFHPDRDELVVAGRGIEPQVWHVASAAHGALAQAAQELQDIRFVEWASPPRLASLGWQGEGEATGERRLDFRVFDGLTGQEVRELRVRKDAVVAALTPDGRFLLSADREGIVTLRDVTDGASSRFEHERPVELVRLSHDGRLLVATGGGEATVWTLPEGPRRRFDYSGSPRRLESGPAGRFLITEDTEIVDRGTRGERRLTVDRVYDLDTGAELTGPAAEARRELALEAVGPPAGDYASGVTGPRTAVVWTAEGQVHAHVEQAEPIRLTAVDSNGDRLATATESGWIRFWPLGHEELIDLACRHLTPDLYRQRWREYLSEEEVRSVCPDRPGV